MKLASFESADGVSYGAVIGDEIVDLKRRFGADAADLKALLARDLIVAAEEMAAGAHGDYQLSDVRLLKPIAEPEKIFCIGVNYVNRNAEYKDGTELPKYPSIFMRTPGSLVAQGEALIRPPESDQLDYEGEIALVIGRAGRRIPEHEAARHVAGLTCMNEGTVRDWIRHEALIRPPESDQLDYEGEIALVIGRAGRRIPEHEAARHVAGLTCMNEGTVRDWIRHGKFNVTQGKNFENSGAIGPWLVTADEFDGFDALRVTTRVNGEVRQDDTTASLLFPFAKIINYVSTFTSLMPGDIIATGTPTGAGARFDPPRFLKPGDVVEVSSPGIGTLSNPVEDE